MLRQHCQKPQLLLLSPFRLQFAAQTERSAQSSLGDWRCEWGTHFWRKLGQVSGLQKPVMWLALFPQSAEATLTARLGQRNEEGRRLLVLL